MLIDNTSDFHRDAHLSKKPMAREGEADWRKGCLPHIMLCLSSYVINSIMHALKGMDRLRHNLFVLVCVV